MLFIASFVFFLCFFLKGFLGAAGASLALILANPFANTNNSLPSVKLPSITKAASTKDTTGKTATAPAAAVKKVEKKQIARARKAELQSGYDLSLDAEVKEDKKAATKASFKERAAEAVAKKDEVAAKEAAKKEDAAIAEEKKASHYTNIDFSVAETKYQPDVEIFDGIITHNIFLFI